VSISFEKIDPRRQEHRAYPDLLSDVEGPRVTSKIANKQARERASAQAMSREVH
jgi:hypothetical protein